MKREDDFTTCGANIDVIFRIIMSLEKAINFGFKY